MASVEGRTVWNRSESWDCICCEGQHVFGYSVRGITPNLTPSMSALDGWIYRQVQSAPEGARLRFTVEVVSD